MYNHTSQSFNSQKQAIYQAINNSYIDTLADFIQIQLNQQSSYYHSLSCLSFSYSKQNYIQQQSEFKFLLYTSQGNIAVPVSDTHWIFLNPPTSQTSTNLQDNMLKNVNVRLKSLQSKNNFSSSTNYQIQIGQGFLFNINEKIQGFVSRIFTFQAEETKQNSFHLYELMLFECSQKKLEKRQRLLSQTKQRRQQNRVGQHYGIAIPKTKQAFKLGDQENIFKLLVNKQEQKANNQQTGKNDSESITPILIQIQDLIYLIGFEKKQEKIIFSQKLIPILNKNLQRVSAKLNLGNQNIGTDGIKYICSEKWRNLTILNLWWNMLGEQGVRLISQAHFPYLKVLDLRKNFVGNRGLDWFRKNQFFSSNNHIDGGIYMKKIPNLEHLLLTDNNLSCVDQINSELFPKLIELQLQNNNLEINCPYSIHIACFKTLKILSLRNNKIEGKGLNTLNLPNLQNLYLSNNLMTTCEPLSQAYLPKLIKLSLSKNKLIQIRSLRKSSFFNSQNMKQIDLSDNEIKEVKGLEQINLWMLEELKLSNKRNDVIKDVDKINDLSWFFKCNLNESFSHRIFKQKKEFYGKVIEMGGLQKIYNKTISNQGNQVNIDQNYRDSGRGQEFQAEQKKYGEIFKQDGWLVHCFNMIFQQVDPNTCLYFINI